MGFLRQVLIITGCLALVLGNLELLWPLNNNTHAAEVIVKSPLQDRALGCNMVFGEEYPIMLPFALPYFDGTSAMDISIPNTLNVENKDYTFSGFYRLLRNDGPLLHYITEDSTALLRELKVVYISSRLYASRKVKGHDMEIADASIALNDWFTFSFGIKYTTGLFKVRINNNDCISIDDNFADNIKMAFPGILRIGGTFDESNPPISGFASCFGFHTDKISPVYTETSTPCIGYPHMASYDPVCPDRNIGHFSNSSSEEIVIQIESSNECSVLKCALRCLRHSSCQYMKYDDRTKGCNSCVLYKIGLGVLNTDMGKLYKLKVTK